MTVPAAAAAAVVVATCIDDLLGQMLCCVDRPTFPCDRQAGLSPAAGATLLA